MLHTSKQAHGIALPCYTIYLPLNMTAYMATAILTMVSMVTLIVCYVYFIRKLVLVFL